MPDCTWAWDKEQGRQETPPLCGDPQGPPSPPRAPVACPGLKRNLGRDSQRAAACRSGLCEGRRVSSVSLPPSCRTPVCARTLGTGQNGLCGPKPYNRHARQVPQTQQGKGLWGWPAQSKVGGSPPPKSSPDGEGPGRGLGGAGLPGACGPCGAGWCRPPGRGTDGWRRRSAGRSGSCSAGTGRWSRGSWRAVWGPGRRGRWPTVAGRWSGGGPGPPGAGGAAERGAGGGHVTQRHGRRQTQLVFSLRPTGHLRC